MATATQYNPNRDLNERLLSSGASKTVYALVTPETEKVKADVFGEGSFLSHRDSKVRRAEYLDMFREAWTGKQDAYHEQFFDTWVEWSKPVVDLDRTNFPFYYPCNGASEPLRHLIYNWAAKCSPTQPIHVFNGEYEGYKAMAEAAYIPCIEHDRNNWRNIRGSLPGKFDNYGLFFISAPSAIDGNVWEDFNAFLDYMPSNSVVVDVTYVGAVPRSSIAERFNLNAPSIRSVVLSLSKPFGLYYDRVGGIFAGEEDPGLFGNKWFKNLTSLALGTEMMKSNSVFSMPEKYQAEQRAALASASADLGLDLTPSDVFILGTAPVVDSELGRYLTRAGRARICVTPAMAKSIGTAR